jgi:hypothetical protein
MFQTSGSRVFKIGVLLLGASVVSAAADKHKGKGHDADAKEVRVVNTPSVKVVNTPTVTVGNTPTVTVGNTANVNVTNVPAVQLTGTAAVTVTNDASTPVAVRNVESSASEPFVLAPAVAGATPFNFTVPSTTSTGKPVKTVVIEFVTADCDAVPGTTVVGVAQVKALFNGNFGFYALPFDAPMQFSNQAEFASAHQTLIPANPGSTVSYGLTGDSPPCTVTFSGHLIS